MIARAADQCGVGAPMSLSNLPRPILALLGALQSRDSTAWRAALCDAAVLRDDGEHRGEAIATWFDRLCRRTDSIRPINEGKRGGAVVVTTASEERDASGGRDHVHRDWHLRVDGNRVSSIHVERCPIPVLPGPVAAYVRATNSLDLEGLMATFADDAFVNDQLCEHWGKQAIRRWAEREVIAAKLTMYVVDVVEHHGHVILSANVNGEFDARGLPDPLVLAFYFAAPDGQIVQLMILQNQPGT
jgi:hypothetical protein